MKVAARTAVAINARSVDTKRVIRVGSNAGIDAFGEADSPAEAEWRQFTLGRLLLFVFSEYEARILEAHRAAGFEEVRQVHFAVTRHIDLSNGTRIGDLATRAGMSQAAMGHIVAEVERLGLVTTAADPADARAKRVMLTKHGRTLIDVTRRCSAGIEAEFEELIGEERFADVRDGLIALREAMS